MGRCWKKTGEIRKKNPETNERYQNLDSSFTFGDLISPVFQQQFLSFR